MVGAHRLDTSTLTVQGRNCTVDAGRVISRLHVSHKVHKVQYRDEPGVCVVFAVRCESSGLVQMCTGLTKIIPTKISGGNMQN